MENNKNIDYKDWGKFKTDLEENKKKEIDNQILEEYKKIYIEKIQNKTKDNFNEFLEKITR